MKFRWIGVRKSGLERGAVFFEVSADSLEQAEYALFDNIDIAEDPYGFQFIAVGTPKETWSWEAEGVHAPKRRATWQEFRSPPEDRPVYESRLSDCLNSRTV